MIKISTVSALFSLMNRYSSNVDYFKVEIHKKKRVSL